MVDLNREYLISKYGDNNILKRQRTIIIKNILFRKVDSNTFIELTLLEDLKLENNKIEEINVNSFNGLSNLKVLSLKNNKLKRIDSNSFERLAELEELELIHNEIEYLDVKSFNGLSNLKQLYLYCNKLKRINSNTFIGLTKLRHLDFGNNEIEEINVEFFNGLSSLLELRLENNKLKRIDSNTFERLAELEWLSLENNQIEEINGNAFKGLTNLKKLYLHCNKLKSIDSNTFQELESLKTLSLYDNALLEMIDVRLFEKLKNLEALALKNNKLINEKISIKIFLNLTVLRILKLSGNKLTQIDDFNLLNTLVNLDVSNNNIESLSDKFFSSFTKLKSINLSFNKFSKITINLANNNEENISIDLSSNRIKDFSNISISYETSYIKNINVDLRFNEIQSIENENLEKAANDPKIKYDLIYNQLSKRFIDTLISNSDYENIFNIKKRDYDHIKKINFRNKEIIEKENRIFGNFEEWSNIEKFSMLTGKNGIGKSSVLNYIQRTSSDMLNSINNFIKTHIYKTKDENKIEIENIFSKYKNFFDLLPISRKLKDENENFNWENKYILYLPVIYRMHDTIKPINIIDIKEIIDRCWIIDSSGKFDRNIIEIFFLELNENNDTFDIVILKNFGNKLQILNDHLTDRGFKYSIEEKNELIEFVHKKTRNRIRAKYMSPGEQLKMLFYIWEFTLSRFNLPFTFVLLLDEPDAHLHPKAVHEFLKILEKLSEAGAQIIMTTHNPTTVSFAKEEMGLFYMKENEDNSITIHKAKSKADAIYELTENLVAVNIPFLTILVEGNDNRFYELVRQKLVDLGSSYACQFIFKGFEGCQQILDCLIFELEEPALNRLKEEINKIVNDENKSVSILDQTIKLITEQRKLSLDHFGIIDNDNHLEVCSNEKEKIKEYYSTRDKHVYNLLRHSLENYVLDPISLYFYLKYQYLNSSSNTNFIVDPNGNFKLLIDTIKKIKIGEIEDPNIQTKLNDIKSIDEFIDWEIDHKDKVQILQTIVNKMGELIIDYLTEFVCFNPRLFYNKEIVNLTPLLRYIEIKNKDKDKDFFLLNWIDSYINGINQGFNQKYKSKQKIIKKNDDSKAEKLTENKKDDEIKDKKDDVMTSQNENIPNLIKVIETNNFFLYFPDRKTSKYRKISEIYKNLIKVMKEIIRIHHLKESDYKKDINDIEKLLNEKFYNYEINKYTDKDIKDIDISILKDFLEKEDDVPLNDPLSDNTTVTKQELKKYIEYKLELDKYLVELIKNDLKETIECHFVDKNNKDIKVNYPKVFYCFRGHNLEETVCKMFYIKYPFFINDKNEVVYFLVKEIIKEDGLFEKCGYLIPNELKEIFDQINTIKKNRLEKEQLEKLKREQEIQINNI